MLSSRSLTYLRSLVFESPISHKASWTCRNCRQKPHIRQYAVTSKKLSAAGEKPSYITTPIFYVNAAPHVGHLYSMVLADTLKRWEVLKGKRALLSTGIDEHGMKVQRAAQKAGSDPLSFCDKGGEVFKQLARDAELQNDFFVRTSSPKHHDAVQYAWQRLQDKGLIYMAEHSGWYSVSDETFVPESGVQLIVDPPTGRKIMVSIETGKEVEWTKEMNYKFDLPSFRDRLLDHYTQHQDTIMPNRYYQEIVSHLKNELQPLSVSRPSDRLTWGVGVPDDPSQTIYVWLDALLNYTTILGYPWPPSTPAMTEAGWPADVQVIGKDITRFHCVYWPAFLMALELPLPKHILVHGHWTMSKMKMSKSVGNVVNPFFALERFGADQMRFYLLHDGPSEADSDYDNRYIIERYKHELQGALGNLASRIVRGKRWSVRGAVQRCLERPSDRQKTTSALIADQSKIIEKLAGEASGEMERLDPRSALKVIFAALHATNRFLQQAEPWSYFKEGRYDPGTKDLTIVPEVDEIIFLAAELLRVAGILLQPFMPNKAKMLLDLLGVRDDRRTIDWAHPGKDRDYGTPKEGVKVGSGFSGVLFPPLDSDG